MAVLCRAHYSVSKVHGRRVLNASSGVVGLSVSGTRALSLLKDKKEAASHAAVLNDIHHVLPCDTPNKARSEDYRYFSIF